jgi:hypothetical protein
MLLKMYYKLLLCYSYRLNGLSELSVWIESHSNKFEILSLVYEGTEGTQSTVYKVGGVSPAGIYSKYRIVKSIDVSQPLRQEEYHWYDDHNI